VQQETSIRTRASTQARKQAGKRMIHIVLFVALAVVPVLALNSFATATPSPASDGGTSDGSTGPGTRSGLTDAQRQCLADQGITLPIRGGRRAAEACGLAAGRVRPFGRALSDEQRQCLTDHGVTLPPTSTESRAALRSAAAACGLPTRAELGARRGAAGTI
jgi:hypothetical protein